MTPVSFTTRDLHLGPVRPRKIQAVTPDPDLFSTRIRIFNQPCNNRSTTNQLMVMACFVRSKTTLVQLLTQCSARKNNLKILLNLLSPPAAHVMPCMLSPASWTWRPVDTEVVMTEKLVLNSRESVLSHAIAAGLLGWELPKFAGTRRCRDGIQKCGPRLGSWASESETTCRLLFRQLFVRCLALWFKYELHLRF
jgi:hypothetical protein